jgi:periplasmic protein TonB
MALRCLVFTADEGTADPIRQVLADLGVEGEHCVMAVDAVAKVTQQSLQIVIIDWDAQPEAGLLLKAARERKAGERPLTLAVVSEDASAPQALQAGANSILRKPMLLNQVRDTLATARDLLRAKESAAAQAAAAAASAGSVSRPVSLSPGNEKNLRAGEFLQSAPPAPGGQFETEPETFDQPSSQVDALKNLEPVAAAVAEKKPVAPPSPEANEPRGLQWYLNQRAATAPRFPVQAPIPAASTPVQAPVQDQDKDRPELLGFDQMSAPSLPSQYSEETREEPSVAPPTSLDQLLAARRKGQLKEEAQLSAYVTGVGEEAEQKPRPQLRLGKKTLFGAMALAACAVVAAPQAPWHAKVRSLWGRSQQALHAWLNPQVVAPAQAPAAHEDFGRAGDEYKLPVAENIPDATTDPAQIRVEPVTDPTGKKPNSAGASDDQSAGPADTTATNPGDQAQSSGIQVQETPTAPAAATGQSPVASPPSAVDSGTGATATAPPATTPVQPRPEAPATATPVASKPQVAPPQIHAVSATSNPSSANPSTGNLSPGNPAIPPSLTSQIASTTPDASGNKAPETALPSIEPVNVPEAAERALLTDHPAVAYPSSAKGQQGTVVLQVLIGRDGTVQDAKFIQGSLAFARTAIDGVKQWKFKPYVMNGRPVSVTTLMTMSFKPGL